MKIDSLTVDWHHMWCLMIARNTAYGIIVPSMWPKCYTYKNSLTYHVNKA
jgi:hypothetical protein